MIVAQKGGFSMKKGLILVLLLAVLSLSGCRYIDTGSDLADQTLEQLIHAVEARDAAAVKSMFAPAVIDDTDSMDQQVSALLDFCTGGMTGYERYGPSTHMSRCGTVRTKYLQASFDLTTTEGDYRIALRICVTDSENPKNVGITSMHIIRRENSDPSHAYWGTNLDQTVGIFIEDPAVWTD